MSGIVGLWNLDGRPLEAGVLARMSATLAHRGPDGEGRWLEGPVGLACQLMRITPESLTETQPLVGPSGSVIVFDGRLDNREELLSLLKGEPGVAADVPDPALVLALYDKVGERFPEYLNGDFALGIFDPRGQRLLLARDAIGLRSLYYLQIGSTFLFASEIKAILSHPQVVTEPNEDFLADLYLKELFVYQQGLTFFKGVLNLLPSQMAIISPRGLSKRIYWDFDPAKRIHLSSFQDYADTFRQLFQQAVQRRLRSAYPVAVAVSGGLDSSAIFCMAETLKRQRPEDFPPVQGLSFYCPDGSLADEDSFVQEIEKLYDSKIIRLPIGPLRFTEKPEEEIRHTEMPFLLTDNFHALYQASSRMGARVILTGEGGDQFLAEESYLIDLFHRFSWRELWRHLGEFHYRGKVPFRYHRTFIRELIKHYLPDGWVSRWRHMHGRTASLTTSLPGSGSKLRQLASRLRNSPFGTKRSLFNVHARSLYKVCKSDNQLFYIELILKSSSAYGLSCAYPLYDRDLIDFLMGIPGEVTNWQGIPKGILRQGLRGILPEAIAARRWKADFSNLENEGMMHDYSIVLDCLQKGGRAIDRGYVEEVGLWEELEKLRKKIRGPNILVARNLKIMIALEKWLQVFLGKKDLEPLSSKSGKY